MPKDLARLESLLVMIDRWSLGYSCAVLLVGILQVPLSYCNVLIKHPHNDPNHEVGKTTINAKLSGVLSPTTF